MSLSLPYSDDVYFKLSHMKLEMWLNYTILKPAWKEGNRTQNKITDKLLLSTKTQISLKEKQL